MPNGTYNVCMAGDNPVAGIMSGETTGQPGHPPCWTTFISVDDVDAAGPALVEVKLSRNRSISMAWGTPQS